jgi:acyl-CoA reductase-like NAD-dependent aldehyde dehydrogenase
VLAFILREKLGIKDIVSAFWLFLLDFFPQAVKRVVDSKTFDNGTICSSEQAVIVDQQVRHLVVQQFKQQGAYFLNEQE